MDVESPSEHEPSHHLDFTAIRVAAGAQVEECLFGAFFGSVTSIAAALGAAVLGAAGARNGADLAGPPGALIGGSVGAAAATAVSIALARWSFKPYWVLLLWFILGVIASAALSGPVREHVEGLYYRWAVGAFLVVLLGGTFAGTVRAVNRQGGDFQGTRYGTGYRGRFLLLTLAALVKVVSRKLLGCAMAGLIGGAFGGAVVGSVMGQVGGKGGRDWYGGDEGAALIGAVLAGVAGLCGGVVAWCGETRRRPYT